VRRNAGVVSQGTRLGGAELRRFDLNLLVGLHALLYFRNVTRAAEHVGVSQPAMSRELRQLRRLFGDELLVRVGREYRLTTLARELIEPLGQVIASIEGAVARRPSFDPTVETRSFTIGMTDYGLLLLLHPLVRRLGTEAPYMVLHHHPTEADPAEMLNSGRVDLVLEPREYLAPGFPSQVLLEDRWMCAVWGGHPEVGESLTTELFERLPRLAFGVGPSGPTSTAELHYQRLGIGGRVTTTVDSFALLPFLLPGTRLVALVQEKLARRFQHATDIRLLEPPVPIPPLVVTMFWSPVNDADPAHAWLRTTLADVARGC
jgi:LysR family transcriptional regulator, nod-box dependent transcriptional activator